jgi:hypothetical protein
VNREYGFSLEYEKGFGACPVLSGGHEHGIAIKLAPSSDAGVCAQPRAPWIRADGEGNVFSWRNSFDAVRFACEAEGGKLGKAQINSPGLNAMREFAIGWCYLPSSWLDIIAATQNGPLNSNVTDDSGRPVRPVIMTVVLHTNQQRLEADYPALVAIVHGMRFLMPQF